MIYSYYSDCGNFKKRNEDAYELHVAASGERMHGMLAVCDGVSTSDDGSYASRFVIAQLHELFAKRNNQAIDWKAEIYRIHDALCAAGLRRRKRYGTTLSVLKMITIIFCRSGTAVFICIGIPCINCRSIRHWHSRSIRTRRFR